MPPALIEGTESLIFFGALIIFPEVQFYLYVTFASLVTITVLQRLLWARKHLIKVKAKKSPTITTTLVDTPDVPRLKRRKRRSVSP